jgi:hypothetical protein
MPSRISDRPQVPGEPGDEQVDGQARVALGRVEAALGQVVAIEQHDVPGVAVIHRRAGPGGWCRELEQ